MIQLEDHIEDSLPIKIQQIRAFWKSQLIDLLIMNKDDRQTEGINDDIKNNQ